MADNADANKIFTLAVKPGIKRDGTRFEGDQYADGSWVRFQRGKAKKMGGYRQMFATPTGIPRGMLTNPFNGVNYVFVGNKYGIEVFNTGTDQGVGVGPFPMEFNRTFAVTAINSGLNTLEVVGDQTANLINGLVFWAYSTSYVRTNYTINAVPTYNSGTNRTTIQVTSLTGFPTPVAPAAVEIYASIYNDSYQVTSVNFGLNYLVVLGDQTTIFTPGTTFWTYNNVGVRTNLTVTATSTYNSSSNVTSVFVASVAGLAAAPFVIYVPTTFTTSDEYLWQFDIAYDSTGNGNSKLLAHPGKNLHNIDSGNNVPLYAGDFLPDPTTNRYVMTQVLDSTGATPTYASIDVSGGLVVLQPVLFAYGNFGQIRNNNVDFTPAGLGNQTFSDWNGPIANDVNVAPGKIIRGYPVRGGTASPSGIFWATDSLVRVSFTSTSPYYWRYDTIATGISAMSSNAFVEMDGIYYWAGTDRFYIYNGSVKVLPNDKNLNYFFDGINFQQRQKVWCTKVPRYNEIWWFYPKGSATECTDAIIYNVKDELWYDAGQAEGARRSCGYITEVFPRPIWCGWEFNGEIGISYTLLYGPGHATSPVTTTSQVIVAGDATTNPAGSYMIFNNDTSFGNINQISAAVFTDSPTGGTTLITFVRPISTSVTTGSVMTQAAGGYTIWEQEFGLNKITAINEYAINSFCETSDISWIGGTPAEDMVITANRRMHITRVEPDFAQAGDMTLTVVGRPFAQGQIEENGPFTFADTDGKIDLRVEHRLVSLRFASNVIDGDYQAGRIMITAELGDERP
jgi:hypothetical protein